MPGARQMLRKGRSTPIGPPRASSGTRAKPVPARATAPAATPRASSTPPRCASAGIASAATVPPSGTAVWRTPSAQPLRAGGYTRNSAPVPAIGTTADPRPETTRPAKSTSLVPAAAAPASPAVARAVPASIAARAPIRSTATPAAISASPEPSRLAVRTAPRPARPRPNFSLSSGPIEGSPKFTNETAAWATEAAMSTSRGEWPRGTARLSLSRGPGRDRTCRAPQTGGGGPRLRARARGGAARAAERNRHRAGGSPDRR